MKHLIQFRALEEKDIVDVLAIYNYHIINGLSNFEEEPHTYENFKKTLDEIKRQELPCIVCSKEDELIGFSYLTKFRNKSGYRFSFENSVYVHHDYVGMGIGNKILIELVRLSEKNRNIKTIIAVIGNDSKASIKIHKKNGFNMIGIIKKVGFKKNKWLDAIYMQKILFNNEKN